MPRTVTAPPTDARLWRLLLARVHPDAGGDHELFIWTGVLRDVVCNSSLPAGANPEQSDQASRRREASTDDKPRIPYPQGADFEEVTRAALRMCPDGLYGDVLSLLADCYPLSHRVHEQDRGAHVEASPSGTGVHIITRGGLERPKKTAHVEVYDQRRFFTVTGVAV